MSARNKRRVAHGRVAAICLALLAATGPAALTAQSLTESEQRGRQIYFEGTSASGGEVNAVVGEEGAVLPAFTLPCASCHGYDGLGRPEGGVTPSDIRWSQLAKNYGHVHERGRRHGPFDDASLGRTILAGLDPAGNRLDRTMPLYRMSADDLADLVAYVKVLETDVDPGVETDRVRVGSLLPLEGRSETLGRAMEAALRAVFADLNGRGGVFGRQVELVTIPLGSTPAASLDNVRQAFGGRGLFALVSGYTIGLDDELLELLRHDRVPLVGPFTLDPGDAYLDAAAFYLYPGFADQARALADQAADDAGDPGRVLVAAPEDGRHDDLAAAALEQLSARGAGEPGSSRYAGDRYASLVAAVAAGDADGIVFLGGSDDLDALLAALDRPKLAPRIYALSALLTRPPFDAPQAFDRRILVAHPTTSSDITDRGRADYQGLASRHGLPQAHIQAQAAAIAAARLFIEGLQRSGRDLSRSRLVDSIEALYNFQTGFVPPLIYGPNRRIGAMGAHVLAVDLQEQRYVGAGYGWRSVK